MAAPKIIPRDPSGKPGTWHDEVLTDTLASRIIIFICPNAHRSIIYISNRSDWTKNWKIDIDGEVHPSIVCHGTMDPDCGYHEDVTLEEWPSEWSE